MTAANAVVAACLRRRLPAARMRLAPKPGRRAATTLSSPLRTAHNAQFRMLSIVAGAQIEAQGVMLKVISGDSLHTVAAVAARGPAGRR